MGRTLLWIVVVAALGAAGWFVFGSSDGEDAGDAWVEVDPFAHGEEGEQGPGLQGTGVTTTRTTSSGDGAFTIKGAVHDEDGNPVADVAIVARYAGKARDPQDPSTWGRTIDQAIDELIARAEQTSDQRYPVIGETRSDGEGRFTLRVSKRGRYRVQAEPTAPGVSPYANVSVHSAAKDVFTTLTVLTGAPFEGRVVDENDKGVACTIQATHFGTLNGTYRAWSSTPQSVDAADGAWRFDAVPQGNVRLEVRLPNGRRITGFGTAIPHDGPYVIRLAGGSARVQGTVTDAAGTAVPGALVMVQVKVAGEDPKQTAHVMLQARSDAAGGFAFADVPLGMVVAVEAAAKGFIPYAKRSGTEGTTPTPVTAEEPAKLEITLERGGTVLGRVTEAGTDTPIAGAVIELAARQNSGPRASYQLPPASTDASGNYRIDGVPQGSYVALPKADGYFLPQMAGVNNSGGMFVEMGATSRGGPAGLTVVVTGEGKEVTRNLELGKGFDVSGRVVDGDGQGVSGAAIHARGYGMSQIAWQWGIGGRQNEPLATSGGDGGFTIQGLPPRSNWVLYAKKDGYAGIFADAFALSADATPKPLELKLGKGAILRGRVEGLTDAQIGNAQIGYWGQGQELAAKSHGHKLKRDGTFELTGVPPGDWTLNAWANGRQGPQMQIKGVTDGEVRDDLVISFTTGVVVEGRVVDSDGEPVSNLNVVLNVMGRGGWHTQLTDKDGRFRFESASEGSAQVMTWGPNGRQIPLGKRFEAPASDIEVVYDKPKTVFLKGTVKASDGTPIAVCSVSVSAGSSRGGSRAAPMPAMGGQGQQEALNGEFQITTSGEGPWTVRADNARGEDGAKLNLRRAELIVKDASSPVVLTMEPGARVSGRVVNADGKPLAGVTVTAGRQNATTTSRDGRFSIEGLGDGNVNVQVAPPTGMVRPPVQRVPTGTEDMEFRLIQGLSIKGKALGPDGKPLTQGYASANWQKTGEHPQGAAGSQIQAGGTFELKGIPPGVRARVQVQVWSQSGTVAYAPAIVEDVMAGTEDLELRLGGGHTIEGRVIKHDGKPPGQCFIYGRTKDGKKQTGWVQVGEDGVFKLGGLDPVAYELQVMRQDGGANPPTTTVTAPASGVEVRLPRSVSFGGRIEGLGTETATGWRVRVYTADGKQVASARVAADGSFDVPAVAELDEVFVGAMKAGDERYGRTGPVKTSAKNVVVRLQRGKSIAGVVEGAVIDERVRGAVWAESADGWMASGVIQKDGTFEIKGLPEGTYTVKARSYDEGNKQATEEGVAAGAAGIRLDVR